LSLAADARAALIPLLGGDRAASRSEIQKLALYARGRGQVDVEDVAAVVSDASALAIEDIVDAAFAGRPGELEIQLGKARTAGTSAGSILFNAQRQLAQLHKWRMAIEQGRAFSLDAVQPPLPFRRRPLVEAALKAWSAVRLGQCHGGFGGRSAAVTAQSGAGRHRRRTGAARDRSQRTAQRGLIAVCEGDDPMQKLTVGITKAGAGLDGIVWNILGQTYVPKAVSESSFSWHATFPPGTFVPPHIHPTQDEFIYMFEGRFDLMLDGKDAVATAGDLIRMPMGLPHGIFNKSDQPVKCFFWVSPTRKLYDLFWAIHSMKEQKPEDVVAVSAKHEVNFLPPPK